MARERKFTTSELYQAAENILLEHGYDAFTFSLLAERMGTSRGVLYKYYENKDELISDYMIHEMERFLLKLDQIREHADFIGQFDFLLQLIFEQDHIPQIIGISQRVYASPSQKVQEQKIRLEAQRLEMYDRLHDFIQLGKEEGYLKPHIPAPVILGFIFQSINIPNHFKIEQSLWIRSVKEVLRTGVMQNAD